MAAFRSHWPALGMYPGDLESQSLAPTLLPEGEIENSPGWSPPQRTEPWERRQSSRRAPRRAARNSPQHVTRIVLDAVFLQKRDELRLKIAPSMMFFLARDVRNCGTRLRHPDGESSVTFLPFKIFFLHCLVHPERRCALKLSHGFCNRDRGRQREQNVNVVLRTANGQCLEAVLARNPAHVRPKSRLDLLRNRCVSFLGGKDAME
jgi:hypothetical protein